MSNLVCGGGGGGIGCVCAYDPFTVRVLSCSRRHTLWFGPDDVIASCDRRVSGWSAIQTGTSWSQRLQAPCDGQGPAPLLLSATARSSGPARVISARLGRCLPAARPLKRQLYLIGGSHSERYNLNFVGVCGQLRGRSPPPASQHGICLSRHSDVVCALMHFSGNFLAYCHYPIFLPFILAILPPIPSPPHWAFFCWHSHTSIEAKPAHVSGRPALRFSASEPGPRVPEWFGLEAAYSAQNATRRQVPRLRAPS